jgi:hypothetical protein
MAEYYDKTPRLGQLEQGLSLAAKQKPINRHDILSFWERIAFELSTQRKVDGNFHLDIEVISYANALADAYKKYADNLS